jgi:hypothetical protein
MNSAAGPVGRVWLPPTRQVKLAILEACRGSPRGVWLLLHRWPAARCGERNDRRCTRSPDYHPLKSHKACNDTLWHRQTVQGTTCFAASVRPAPLGRRGSSPDRDAVGCADVRAGLDGCNGLGLDFTPNGAGRVRRRPHKRGMKARGGAQLEPSRHLTSFARPVLPVAFILIVDECDPDRRA